MTSERHPLGERHYYLDWLRVSVFAYLVFFHTGKMFVESSFHIHSGQYIENLKLLLDFTGVWRLDLLFFVSGVAISFMISKMSLLAFSWQRFLRLFIPVTFAIFVVVAPQSYYEALQKGFIEEGFLSFWYNHYITFSWLDGMRSPFPTYNHMWYVVYLLIYTFLMLPVFMLLKTDTGQKFINGIGFLLTRLYGIIWIPFLIFFLIRFLIGHSDVTNNFAHDPYGHSLFVFCMLLGIIFVRVPNISALIDRTFIPSIILGGLSVIVYLDYQLTPVGTYPKGSTTVLYPFIKWGSMLMLICVAKRFLNKPSDILNKLNGMVYPFFILHQTIIIIIGYYIINWGMSPIWEFWVISIGTLLIGYLLIELAITKTNILRLLFGMKPIEKKKKLEVIPNIIS